MKKRVLGGLGAACLMSCFGACSAPPANETDGTEILPGKQKQGDEQEGKPELEIRKVYESQLQCKAEACFEIESDRPLDFVGIDASVEAEALSFFRFGKDGEKLSIESAVSASASVSIGSALCEAIPEDCLGVVPAGEHRVMACVTADLTTLGSQDLTVHASAGGSCGSSSFSLTASVECTSSHGPGDCQDPWCEGENDNDGTEEPDAGDEEPGDDECKHDTDDCKHPGDDGQCVLGKVLCDGLCVDLDLDLKNCGVCGNLCDLGKCLLGKCVL